MTTPIPVRPDFRAAASSQSRSFWRAITARVLGTLNKEHPETLIERVWGRDEQARLLTRATSSSATTSSGGADLVAAGFGPYVSLAPLSAAAALYPNCLQLSFDGGVNTNVIPKVTTPPTATWISEGSPSTIVQSVYGTVQVGPPRKLLFGAAVTGELQRYGPDTALQIIQRTLIDAATSALDSALLDATAADATRPAGLLNGVSDLGATAGANLTALITDLAKLAGAISDAKIDAESLVLIMNSRQAIVLRGLLTGPKFDRYTIIGTPALSAGTVVAVAPAGIALYLSPPQIEVSGDGLVHMDSSAPRNIDTQAVGETVKSAWQANLLLLKIRMRATWAPLAAAAVQKIDSATW